MGLTGAIQKRGDDTSKDVDDAVATFLRHSSRQEGSSLLSSTVSSYTYLSNMRIHNNIDLVLNLAYYVVAVALFYASKSHNCNLILTRSFPSIYLQAKLR